MNTERPIAIVGAGSIGVAWALVFAMAGFPVRLQDPDAGRRAAAPGEIAGKAGALIAAGLLGEPEEAVMARVAIADTLDAALDGARHVQENAPEQVAVEAGAVSGVRAAGTLRCDARLFLLRHSRLGFRP